MDYKASQSQFWRLSPTMLRKHQGRSSNYDTADRISRKLRCSMIKTHMQFVQNLCETEHFSGEFTNGSSADATGSHWRFQAENLRQITIYQLMKPLKIIPRPPAPAVLAAASLTSAACESRSHRIVSCNYIRPQKPNCVGCGGGGGVG